MSQYLILIVIPLNIFAEYCETVSGQSTGLKCIFPFIYQGTTYNHCPKENSPTKNPWCSTKVDDNGYHVGGGGHWGHCSSDCPTKNEQRMRMEYNKTGKSMATISLQNIR